MEQGDWCEQLMLMLMLNINAGCFGGRCWLSDEISCRLKVGLPVGL
jgi:hypothetical protein